MRIGLEATCLCTPKPTGIARYSRNLIYQLNTISKNHLSLKTFFSYSRIKNFKYRNLSPSIEQQIYISSLWPFNKKVELIHGLDSKIPLWPRCKKILTIHDLLLYMNTSENLSPKEFRDKKKKQLDDLLPHLDGIISVSQHTKNDIVKQLGFPSEKIHVTHLGVDPQFQASPPDEIKSCLQTYKLDNTDYVLFIGAISGRKNTTRMVEAFTQSKLKKSMTFILAGGLSYEGEKTQQKIISLGMSDKIKILPFIKPRDLVHLYSGARALIFPTLYEGFGIPILEAMACGTPVLTSTTGSAPEISGKHAILVNPYDIEDIKRGMEQVVTMQTALLEKAKEYAQAFTWSQTADKTLTAYKAFIYGQDKTYN